MDQTPQQRGQEWLSRLLELAGLPAAVQAESVDAHIDGSCWLTIDTASLSEIQIERLLSDHGAVLDSMQYLINTTLNLGLPQEEQQPYTIELAGYRARRQQELQQMAAAAAAKVRETGEEYELASLSSAERRQVHTFLKEFEDLETFSRGQEPDRRLVVKPRSVEA